MNAHTLHISPYDLAFLGTIFIGLNFTLLLWFGKRINRAANRFLALALATIVLWMAWLLGIDIHLTTDFPHWSWLPLQFSLALGPLIYFYVLKITRPAYKLRWKDLLHFSPLLLQQGVLVLEVRESIRTGAATYDTLIFRQLSPVSQLLAVISVITYLYLCRRLIRAFHWRLKANVIDRSPYQLRGLRRLLTGFGRLWLLWTPFTALNFFYSHNHSGIHPYYPLYLLLAVMMIRIAAAAFLRPDVGVPVLTLPVLKPSPAAELKQKGTWLRKVTEDGLFYQDTELSLSSLAEELDIHPHELSRIINIALKKNFNDFINEYRIREVTRKMQDPAFDRLTLLGIAFDSGFNSKSTFHRTFKQMTGQSPAEYKSYLEKELPTYHLRPYSHSAALVLNHEATPRWSSEKLKRNYMIKNFWMVAWRNLLRNRTSSLINIGGLAVGLVVAMVLGLWVWDELTFDQYCKNYDRIAQVMQQQTYSGQISTQGGISFPMGRELQTTYGSYFTHVVMSSYAADHILAAGNEHFSRFGIFMDKEGPEMFSLKMTEGNYTALSDPHSVIISQTAAKTIFGNREALHQLLRVDNKLDVKVTGVYEDLPQNTTLYGIHFIGAWDLYKISEQWIMQADMQNQWDNNSFQLFVQLAPNADIASVNKRIINSKQDHVAPADKIEQTKIFLNPMSDWHLRSNWDANGNAEGGLIIYVRLFIIIAIFVLLLACINFMNLSTARSEKRAKEIGIRKTIGSLRWQIIAQFYAESILVVLISFVLSILLAALSLPFFNSIAGKNMHIPFTSPAFWIAAMIFAVISGLIAGSYPAIYLSSFDPVRVLKGTFKAGKLAALPRKVLVVLQFTISVALAIGTIVVYKQVQYSKDRPIGYDSNGIMTVMMKTPDFYGQSAVLQNELKKSGAVTEFAEAAGSVTNPVSTNNGFSWPGMQPGTGVDFVTVTVTYDYGRTVNWQIKQGRDFSRDFATDSSAVVLNETSVKVMGLKDPVGATIRRGTGPGSKVYHVIGVVRDMVMVSPYNPVQQGMFFMDFDNVNCILMKLNPKQSIASSLSKIEAVFKKFIPSVPFEYTFADTDFASKYAEEERIGKLSSIFAALAIFISCLGLFGLVAFVTVQRTKEIGMRKLLGASVAGLWLLLSWEFIVLVGISLLVAIPVSYYFMHNWLLNYAYRTSLSAWIFAAAAIGAFAITLMTVSYLAVRAAKASPAMSLRSE
ncbi:MAG TPA: ABC transporter permease [Mucilaginibacter sp.]|nr:ABC transporter permease [Mucilaginibacter sp.]